LKNIACEYVSVDLLSGESESPEHRQRNPLGYVPALQLSNGSCLIESVAILEWAEESYPEPKLLPGNSFDRAQIRGLTEVISADTQPLQNLSAQIRHSADPAERVRWAQHWIRNGLEAYEILAKHSAGLYSVGDQITLADLCLIPQCYNAIRNEVDLAAYPRIQRIYENAMKTEACHRSHPDRFQPA